MDFIEVPRLMPDSQRCQACEKGNRTCTFSGDRTACDSCHSKKVKCSMPSAAAPSVRSSSIVSSAAPSLPSSLARGVEALGVADSAAKTPSRKDKRKVDVGSSPEDQPPRRRSRPNLKETVVDVDTPSPDSSGGSKAKNEDIVKRIGKLETRMTTLANFYSKSVEDLQEDLKELRSEVAGGSKGKGKRKA
jgi:hypothetical protein